MPSDFPYGGQAVIHGVMIRGRSGMAVACRRRDGTVRLHTEQIKPLTSRHRLLALPFIRGTPALLDALALGFRSLIWSADAAVQDEGHKPINPLFYALTIAISLVIAIVLFGLVPSGVVPKFTQNVVALNFLEGLVRMALFLLYVLAIMQMKDIQRLFQYHGAEHKVVNAFEAGAPLSEASRFSPIHRRCGTNFIATVILVGIVVHLAFGWPPWYWRYPIRILSLPIIAGISYEVLRAAGKRPDSRLYAALVWPGLLLQRLTTREPTEQQLEVARKALEAVIETDSRAPEARQQEREKTP